MKKVILFFCLLFSMILISGCSRLDKYKVDMGIKNKDFEYISQGNVNKVIIKSIRDKGFKFTVTDEKSIQDIYDILSVAKPVNEKSLLQPDYIFEIYTQDNVIYKFNYVAGLDKKDLGNFYSDSKNYIVSKRIDNDLISNFWDIRSPQNFQYVYYKSLLAALDNYRKNVNKTETIGIDITDDVDVAKFILSVDLDDFTSTLNSKDYNAELLKATNSNYGVIMNIKTDGYKADKSDNTGVYKCTITFDNKKENSSKIYYIFDKYKESKWDIQVYAGSKPEDY